MEHIHRSLVMACQEIGYNWQRKTALVAVQSRRFIQNIKHHMLQSRVGGPASKKKSYIPRCDLTSKSYSCTRVRGWDMKGVRTKSDAE